MAGRNRMPPPHYIDDIGGPPSHLPPQFPPRGGPHRANHFIDELGPPGGGIPFGLVPPRGGPPPQRAAHHHAIMALEERMVAQHEEIQGLLADNQRLAATHVALKQEVEAATHELQRLSRVAGIEQAEGEARINEIYEKSMKMEGDFRASEGMRAELTQVLGDIQKINAARQELTSQVQMLTQDMNKATAEVQQVPAIKAEIEYMKQELQQARQAIEYEKKGYAENYEQGQEMEKNLISMAREVEKLRAEVANTAKRAKAAAAVAVANQTVATAAGYGVNYANPDPSNYGGNPYPAAYQSNPVPTADSGSQYPSGGGNMPVNGSWGTYDMQHSQHAMRR